MIRLLFKAYDRMKAVAAMQDGKVFIRGAGEQGKLLKEEFDLMGIPVAGFLDINAGTIGNGTFHPDYAYSLPADKIFIACSMSSTEAYASVRLDMAERGLEECVHFADFGLISDERMLRDNARPLLSVRNPYSTRRDAMAKRKQQMRELHNRFSPPLIHEAITTDRCSKFHLGGVGIVPTTKCTLNCKYCLRYMSVLKSGNTFLNYNPSNLISDLEKLLSVCSTDFISFAGADIFLHPEIDEIFERFSKIDLSDVGILTIFSNGVIIPKDKTLKIIAALNKQKPIGVYLSNYGKHSKNNKALKEKLSNYGISFFVAPLFFKWNDLGDYTTDRNYSEEELRHLYSICECSVCTTLQDGRLYSCSMVAGLSAGNLTKGSKAYEYVDIRNEPTDILKEKLEYYLYETPYLNSCRYCNGMYAGAKEVIRGLQAKCE